MDRIALSQRLEGLSKVFASDTPMHRDLKAMSHVLSKMSDDNFSKVIDAEYVPDVESAVEEEAAQVPPMQGPQTGPAFMQKVRERAMERGDVPTTTDPSAIADALEKVFAKKPGLIQKIFQALSPQEKKEIIEVMPTPDFEKARGVPTMPGLTKSAEEDSEDNKEDDEEKEGQKKYAGMFWNRKASDAVLDNLLRDVVGMSKTQLYDTKRKLTPDQTPDGKHAGVPKKPATLKTEQAPDQTDVIDSNMVDESKTTSVRKEAGSKKGPGKPDGTGPYGGTSECQMADEKDKDSAMKYTKKENPEYTGKKGPVWDEPREAGLEELEEQKAEKAEEKAEKLEQKAKKDIAEGKKNLEKAEKVEEKAEKAEKEATTQIAPPTVIEAEGIEMSSPMDDIEMSSEEAEKLSRLFM